MELKYEFMLYVAIGLVIILSLFLIFFTIKKKGYKKGKRIAGLDYVQHTKTFKRKLVAYKILSNVCLVLLVLSVGVCSFVIARPFSRYTVNEQKYSRDIILCMDISSSVDKLNSSIMKNLKKTVEELEGDRIGVVIFNTSPVVLCPLTDDYKYVLDILDKVEEGLNARHDYYYSYFSYNSDMYDKMNYISSGTLIGNMERGSSLIGDGLAAASYCFTSDDPDRSRVIIFSSDNALEGTPLVTTKEAAEICKKNNVIVYGVGTYDMSPIDDSDMKEAVELTGGKYYRENYSGSMKEIVNDIEQMSGSLIEGTKEVREADHPENLIILLFALVAISIISTKVIRL